jgi:NAD-dependent SIR2 family protein deacetylase
MIDPILSLVFSMTSNKGAYALLLGSGISRSSGVPTGWEITQNLIEKVALLSKENTESNPELWYRNKFNKEPNYSELLNEIAKTPIERNTLLKQYFEPTEEEIRQNLKLPTRAHQSIAKLVKEGYIRVIITTNFDRLLENALEKENIRATIISNSDSIKGAYPIIHSSCTIIKVNGDYLDTRIKNTYKELEKYDEDMNSLLDRVLDEFGLIVCGWSAEWDIALRAAIERCKNRRFSCYWTINNQLSPIASKLVSFQDAQIINNFTADKFFNELLEKVISVSQFDTQHPLSSKIAIVTAKRYLSEDKFRINLSDLLFSETKLLIAELSNKRFDTNTNNEFSIEEFLSRVSLYESKTEVLLNLFITVCYWGNSGQCDILTKCIESVINHNSNNRAGYTAYLNLIKYPTLLLMYGACIASLINGNYYIMKSILLNTNLNDEQNLLLIHHVSTFNVIEDKRLSGRLHGQTESRYTPFNDYLAETLYPFFLEYLLNKDSFLSYFDKFEYLLGLIYADTFKSELQFWAPFGSFAWRNRYSNNKSITKILGSELLELKENHPLLKVGLFNYSYDRIMGVKKQYDEFIGSLHFH